MKFLGFLIFVFVFLMAFWAIMFLASVIPYFIFVWIKEGKLDNDPVYVRLKLGQIITRKISEVEELIFD
mgnify:CR=1 FL=1